MPPFRILYYNWVDYLDDERRGGGVSVYQRNLIAALRQSGEAEATFLSAGIAYDLRGGPPRWERTRTGPELDRSQRFEIVNSEVLSPSHHSFGDPAQAEAAATQAAFEDFIAKTGPYDVIHFNNLEGLPAGVLRIAQRWPHCRVILSLHNYYPFCPQVNLWQDEARSCLDYDHGNRCPTCLPYAVGRRQVRLANALAYRLKRLGMRPGGRMFDLAFRPAMAAARRAARLLGRLRRRPVARLVPRPVPRVAPASAPPSPAVASPATGPGQAFAARRAAMVRLINENCDRVLCVSQAVETIARHHGVDPAILRTSYIGTVEADRFRTTQPRATLVQPDGTLCIAYLGYMRHDKGFFFLLDALETLPVESAARLRVVIAAQSRGADLEQRIEALRPRLAGLDYRNGYSHDDLDGLLDQVDLGLVPVLWNDNLPQVAIEMHARHIPLLTSDLGGAQELGNCPDLVFPAGDKAAFAARIAAILSGAIDLKRYWAQARPPVTMAEHLRELTEIYSAPRNTGSSVQGTDTAGS